MTSLMTRTLSIITYFSYRTETKVERKWMIGQKKGLVGENLSMRIKL
jgi:hypothetical protein